MKQSAFDAAFGHVMRLPLGDPLDPSSSDAKQWARDELGKWEYQAAAGTLQAKLARWIDSVLENLTFSIGDVSIRGEYIIVAVALLIVIAIAASLVVAGPAKRRMRAADPAQLDAATAATSASDLFKLVETAYANEDWREYCLCGFRYSYRVLLDREIVDFESGRTAFEVATAAAQRLPSQRELLWEAAHIFSTAAYSDHPITRSNAATLEKTMHVAETARPTYTEAPA